MTRAAVVLLASVLLSACASKPPVNMSATRRVVGTENAVRIDAEIVEEMRVGGAISITYVITNQRPTAIAVADILPETTYDREAGTMTVSIGSEVPGEVTLPRLVRIDPGEKKSFTTAARVGRVMPMTLNPQAPARTLLRLKVNFLGDTTPFAELIDIPERFVASKERADALFAPWLERNEVLYTNAIPVQVSAARNAGPDASDSGRGTRSGRRPRP
jgi:hypothetical protein